ncbi:MAG: class II aldolase/adducin family protein [Firmicutes bacterium]|nr:class II aldolase/adducin family protein [Bacillota bacterium]
MPSDRIDERAFAVVYHSESEALRWLMHGLSQQLRDHGFYPQQDATGVRIAFNVTDKESPVPLHRKAQATFLIGVTEWAQQPENVLQAGYKTLVSSLSNMVLLLICPPEGRRQVHFVTPELGHYEVTYAGDEAAFFGELYERLAPLATSHLVIDNIYDPDLPPALWDGDEKTRSISWAGRKLAAMHLLPTPFPLEEVLDEHERRHIMKIFGIGGLSYGNISCREEDGRFWMSASGVDKSKLEQVGRDILLVKGYDAQHNAMRLSVRPDLSPRRVSVDAIEHWMVYQEHPEIGAIVHVHTWMEGIPTTQVNYPCGTREVGLAVSELLRQQPDPGHAVLGLKNHGINITGESIEEIFERVGDRILPTVPMS